MVISRPCQHPDCPPRDGFIRGEYESVEFIREIRVRKTKSSSTTDLIQGPRPRDVSPPLEKEALLRSAEQRSPAALEEIVREGRKRGRTISFAVSRGSSAKGEAMDIPQDDDDAESNPVEWIMITRSDPGGSVPRFMVERGTPGSIVADASKFLDWACKKEHPEDEIEALNTGDMEGIKDSKRKELEAYDTNGHLAGLDGTTDEIALPTAPVLLSTSVEPPARQQVPSGLLATVANVAYAGIENYAPQAVVDRLHQQSPSMSTSVDSAKEAGLPNGTKNLRSPSISSTSSVASFASAEDHFDDTLSTKSALSATSQTKSSNSKDTAEMSPHEKELAKLNDRKKALNEKLAKAREKEIKDKEELTSKEEERIRKAEEKHAREIQKQEEKYKKEIAKLEAKRQKEATQLEVRKKKAEDKDEKVRLTREKEEIRQELDVVSKERDILRDQVGALQKENTVLVVRLGKMEEGKNVLKEVKSEIDGGNRSRSGSLRREKGKEATILGGDKTEGVEAMK